MRQIMVANMQKKGRYDKKRLKPLLKAQIELSLEHGWKPEDILLITNFKFRFMGVTSLINDKMNKHCLTGSKMFALDYIFSLILDTYPTENELDEIFWTHDLDCFQNIPFKPPKMKDVGITTYSNSKYNGGSVFWRPKAYDIVANIIYELQHQQREEPTLNKILKHAEFKNRVTRINNTYNVGCSGFIPRFLRAKKPICVSHMNPCNRIAWETHRLDRNGIGAVSISCQCEKILRKYFPHLAIELSEEGKSRSKELRQKNEKHLKQYSKKLE